MDRRRGGRAQLPAWLRGWARRTPLCAVVKADGYGHGAVGSPGRAGGGASWLAVAAAAEAASCAALADARILTMGALTEAELDDALAAASDVAVWQPAFADWSPRAGRELGIRPRLHLKYDTGMGRLGSGIPTRSCARRSGAAEEGLELVGLWTHFATADEPDSAFFERAARALRDLAGALAQSPGVLLHAANSAATLREALHFDMVRCGVAIYGLDPFQADPAAQRLEPALELRSYVADVKLFEAGARAGYGQRWRAPADTWSGCFRSATGTASDAASPTTPRCWWAAAATRWSAPCRWTTSRLTSDRTQPFGPGARPC